MFHFEQGGTDPFLSSKYGNFPQFGHYRWTCCDGLMQVVYLNTLWINVDTYVEQACSNWQQTLRFAIWLAQSLGGFAAQPLDVHGSGNS